MNGVVCSWVPQPRFATMFVFVADLVTLAEMDASFRDQNHHSREDNSKNSRLASQPSKTFYCWENTRCIQLLEADMLRLISLQLHFSTSMQRVFFKRWRRFWVDCQCRILGVVLTCMVAQVLKSCVVFWLPISASVTRSARNARRKFKRIRVLVVKMRCRLEHSINSHAWYCCVA